jgi:molecular chaperone GrpE
MSHKQAENSDNFTQPEVDSEEQAVVEEQIAPEAAEAEAANANAEAKPAEEAKKEEPKKPAEPTLEQKYEEMRNNYLRALADCENTRKRMAREMQDLRESTRMNTIGEIVGIFDLLKMASDSTATATDMATIQMGVKMIFDQFKTVLTNMGVSVIDAKGQKFDPKLHEAISTANSDDVPEGTVLQQWNFGFKLGERILRPARVVVSAGPKAAEKPAAEAPAEATPSDTPAAEESK